jgi:hypothetical protein
MPGYILSPMLLFISLFYGFGASKTRDIVRVFIAELFIRGDA